MTPPDDDPDSRLADLLASANDGVSAPDAAFLARVRDQSTDTFLAAGTTPAAPSRTTRFAMIPLLARLSAAALAAAVLIAAGLQFWPSSVEAATLSVVLDRVADAETLHLQVTKDDRTTDVWVAKPNRLRWDDTADRYLIVDGLKATRVDEAANRASSGVGYYFRADRPGVDLFALLGAAKPSPKDIRNARKLEQTDRDGVLTDIFRVALPPSKLFPTEYEFEVEAATGQLRAARVFETRNGVVRATAAFTVLAQGQPVAAEKFAVKETLSEDGRVGKIADVQGLVSVKPILASRWTPIRPNVLLVPGDWVRADVRGPNAARLQLLPRASVIVGPGGLLEVLKPTQVRLHEGEAEFSPVKNTPIELVGPDGKKVVVKEREHYRVQGDQLVKVAKEPLWLKGFKGTTTTDSVGSLVAKVDGRNVSLSVGYHKVTVDVRDQIARTTIEESFVNHTDSQLEGQFHFPLPQDASIAGFGMWIGNELVEADIVEKQRAREIYEEIMRERRDPGLLEWTGGNIFKARVWPIFAHSEKRIKITYTQVLPLNGNKYRYSYALHSEMLQLNPLKELSIDVKVNSAAPLKSVASPTHSVRASQTEHSAHLEFSAQQHTPTKDFEAVIEVSDKTPEVAVVPHRRGTDGYFLLQVTPPAPATGERELLGDAGPLDVLLVCDTSASIDPSQRAHQNAVAAAVLEALTPKDTFNLLACDVNADAAFDKPRAATPENVRIARSFATGRVSLGWTDLDKAFASALQRCGPKTQVIYLGDGVITTGDANPQAFAERLRTLYAGSKSTATFHAVALGSSFEPGVLKAIGSLGGGSVRRVTGERGPVAIALELLGEITRPPVRDLKVEFRGWKTASIYPETLPNLVPGTQQILIGRYLPEGKDQQGEVIVSGVRDGKEIRYTAAATLKDAEAGNSFIPRLWARMQLDKLLEQPQTDAVKDDVIALSEEFGIITPYTSFLVLESDADRERFKVKRRFQMRDGEAFFAKGRDNAEYDLARQQMKRAASWRTGLRRNVLSFLGGLGRDQRVLQVEQLLQQAQQYEGKLAELGSASDSGVWFQNSLTDGFAGRSEMGKSTLLRASGGFGGDLEQLALDDLKDGQEKDKAEQAAPQAASKGEPEDEFNEGDKKSNQEAAFDDQKELAAEGRGTKFKNKSDDDVDGLWAMRFRSGESNPYSERLSKSIEDYPSNQRAGSGPGWATFPGYAARTQAASAASRYSRAYYFDNLFPTLSAPPTAAKLPKSDWPAEARDLAALLVRRETLTKLAGGLKIERLSEAFNAGALNGRERRLELYSPTAWASRSEPDNGQTLIEWCDAQERGVIGAAFRLGRVRASDPADLHSPPFRFDDYAMSPLIESHATWAASVEKVEGSPVLVLKQPGSGYETRYTIDAEKRVVRKTEHRQNGKTTLTNTCDDFVEVGGVWWARTTTSTEPTGKHTTRITLAVTALNAGDFAAQVKGATAGREGVLLLRSPEPSVSAAKKALAAGTAKIDERYALLNYYAGFQQWTKASEQLEALEKLSEGKPGVRWLRTAFLQASRRGEELRKRVLEEADALAKLPIDGNRVMLAGFLLGHVQPVLAYNEQLELVDRLRSSYAEQPAHVPGLSSWKRHRAEALSNAGRADEALAAYRELALDNPRDHSFQMQHAQLLYQRGDRAAAYEFLKKRIAAEADSIAWEAEQTRSTISNWYHQEGRVPELVEFLAGWVKLNPTADAAYSQYLSALIVNDEEAKAYEFIARWLKEAQVPGEVPAATQARFRAAANVAMGQGQYVSANRIDAKWHKPLAEASLFFLDHPKLYGLAGTIVQNWRFQQNDESRRVRQELLARLNKRVETMPVGQLVYLAELVTNHPPEADKATWTTLTAGIRARWQTEPLAEWKHQLGQSLGRLLAMAVGPDEQLQFLRQKWKEGPAAHRSEYAATLFQVLLNSAWTAAKEEEAFALLAKPDDADLPTQVRNLHQMTDRMLAARFEAARKGLEHPEKLTRTELAKKTSQFHKDARLGFAQQLAKAEAALPKALRPWAKAERLTVLIRAEADAKPLAAECWAFLGDAPKARPQDEEPTADRILGELLRDRYLTMAMHFATRRDATPDLIDRLAVYLDAGIAAEPNEPGWKAAKFQLFVALDRPKPLEQAVAGWVKDDAEGRWRVALGYLAAEQGRLKEAIAGFEEVEKKNELGYAEYQALAGWYMAVNSRESHEKALVSSFKVMDENRLYRLLGAKLSPWQRGGTHLPSELDKDVLRVFAALFEKSAHPQNYLGYLHSFYQACRDFRLLAVMCDAVIGQSAGKVYPFLQGMQNVLNEVRDEATADELFARIDVLRKSAKTPIDLRALDLLEMQVRRRAAEMKNQPDPHAEKALAAMKRAFDRPWADGEPVMMSELLHNLGKIGRRELADEQVRELRDLHAKAKPGTLTRLTMAQHTATVVFNYDQQQDGITLLGQGLDEFAAAKGGVLPVEANNAVMALVTFHERATEHTKAEARLLALLAKPANPQQGQWLAQRLFDLYHRTLQTGGTVSLGTGALLYRALEQRLVKELDTPDSNHRSQLISGLCQLYRTAKQQNFPTAVADTTTFAHKTLPPFLKKQTTNYQSNVSNVAATLRELAGSLEAVQFLVDRMEEEPRWLRLNNQDGWAQHCWSLAQWRADAKVLPAKLEARLLKIVLTELRADLRSQLGRGAAMYWAHHSYYWSEKEADFADVAEAVYAERKASAPAVQYVAGYFYGGCNRPARAIAVLFAAHEQKLLRDDGQLQLVNYLHAQNRHAESIALLLPLIERSPNDVNRRTLLFTAYYRTGRREELTAAFAAAEKHFRDKDRWHESPMSVLASFAVECELFERAVAIYGELIPLHKRTHPHQGIGNGVLSNYYQMLSRAESRLGHTLAALDAASAAIVSWGANTNNRANALQSLKTVLNEARDLEKVVAELDKQTGETGLINPVVRKAVGGTYYDKGEFVPAMVQLQLALSAQPNDAETRQWLINCQDKLKNPESAVQQVLQALDLNRRDLKSYEDLGRRYEALGRAAEAERAYTSLVEVLPNETEGHALLAEIRQKQDRWPDAMRHWEQVARIRALEPTGLLKLTAAQIHERQYDKAAETLAKLKAKPWPAHFGDVASQIAELDRQIQVAKK